MVISEKQRGKLVFGRLLRGLRLRAGLTQRELGEKIEVSKPVISHYECGFRLPGRVTMGKIKTVLELGSEEYVSLLDAAND